MAQPGQVLIIESDSSESRYWADIWRYRELFYFLSWRDVLVRYKQTVMGVAWAVVRPVLTMVVFTVIFGKLAKLPSSGTPYPILVFAAMLPWQLFAGAFADSSGSVVANASLITRIYFPRLIIPTSAIVVNLIDFTISFGILLVMMACYRHMPDWRIFYLPVFLLLAVITALGAGVWISALNVQYRDFRYIVPFLVQLGIYISPVGFSSSIIPEKWRLFYSLNPMTGVIDGFRWSILGGKEPFYWQGLVVSSSVSGALLVASLKYFRKVERSFADII